MHLSWPAASLLIGLTGAAPAQAAPDVKHEIYPNRPVRFVIPFAAAGSNDVVARILAHQLTDIWKQQVVADNRAGANGIIGIDMVAKAPPDGYTLLIASRAAIPHAADTRADRQGDERRP